MKNQKLYLRLIATGFAGFIAGSTAFAQTCPATIENPTSYTWKVEATGYLGDVYFSPAPPVQCANTKDGPCTIPPGKTLYLAYSYGSAGEAFGRLYFYAGVFYYDAFVYQGFNEQCPTVSPLSGPSYFQLNSPNNGDIIIQLKASMPEKLLKQKTKK